MGSGPRVHRTANVGGTPAHRRGNATERAARRRHRPRGHHLGDLASSRGARGGVAHAEEVDRWPQRQDRATCCANAGGQPRHRGLRSRLGARLRHGLRRGPRVRRRRGPLRRHRLRCIHGRRSVDLNRKGARSHSIFAPIRPSTVPAHRHGDARLLRRMGNRRSATRPLPLSRTRRPHHAAPRRNPRRGTSPTSPSTPQAPSGTPSRAACTSAAPPPSRSRPGESPKTSQTAAAHGTAPADSAAPTWSSTHSTSPKPPTRSTPSRDGPRAQTSERASHCLRPYRCSRSERPSPPARQNERASATTTGCWPTCADPCQPPGVSRHSPNAELRSTNVPPATRHSRPASASH